MVWLSSITHRIERLFSYTCSALIFSVSVIFCYAFLKKIVHLMSRVCLSANSLLTQHALRVHAVYMPNDTNVTQTSLESGSHVTTHPCLSHFSQDLCESYGVAFGPVVGGVVRTPEPTRPATPLNIANFYDLTHFTMVLQSFPR